MSAEVFYSNVNELATLTNTFSVAGVPTDPTLCTLAVTSPAGVVTQYTGGQFTHTPASGVYSIDIPCTEAGVWLYLWVGTGTASDAVAGTWTVQPIDTGTLYCTPEELKSRAGIGDALDDFEILAACRAVSRWIDNHCDRHFFRTTATRTFVPDGYYTLNLPDLVSITTLKTDGTGDGVFETTWAVTDYQLLPANPTVYEQRPYTKIKAVGTLSFPFVYSGYAARTDRIQIVGVWGWPAVPDSVKQAAAIMAADFLKLGGMAFGVQGYGDYGAIRARLSGPAVQLLDPYRKHPMLVA